MPARLLTHFDRLTTIGKALSSERDTARLLEMILLAAKEMTAADGGTLYSVHDDGTVSMDLVRTDSLDFAMGGSNGRPIPFPPIPLRNADGAPNHGNVVTYAVLNDCTVNITDAYAADRFDLTGTREFDSTTGYRSVSFLTVPMKDHEGTIIGVLQLINAQGPDGRIVPFDGDAQRLVEALASQAAVALTNRRLIDGLKELLDSLIHLIAYAIDEKSPYTGGHCRRVPLLTLMLADAAAGTTEGPLAGFSMTEADRYELEIAAWLHDCGKITTPEYVIDKATKLQTIFDRIELVETRMEILRRDAEIRALRRRLAAVDGEAAVAAATAEADSEAAALADELALLRRCNTGGERMAVEDQECVRAIGKRTWTDAQGKRRPLLTDDEAYNLTIRHGTLTPEERALINNHIVATNNILEALPFPRHLRHVPEYAGGHHERMDGKGYPRGLTGAQMSVQARIMAIADVFEALTARDRPYKTGKKLSESLTILAGMARNGHIDPDLFDLFMRERIYLRYAEQYLEPGQLDLAE